MKLSTSDNERKIDFRIYGKWESSVPIRNSPATTFFEGGTFQHGTEVVGYIKLQIPAGKATPAPPVGPALGQHGVNIMAFTKEFNERNQERMPA